MAKTIIEQFNDLKTKHPEVLLLFRCGDFYETYNEDAEDVSKILSITLTKRNTGKDEDEYAMAGFPYHALSTYLPKLIRAGKRVAICNQPEEPKKKAKRGITEVVEPAPAPQPQAEPQAEEMSATGAPTLLELVNQSVNVIKTLTEKLEKEIVEKDKEIEVLQKELEQEREKVSKIAELIK